MSVASHPTITIRSLLTHAELDEAVALQRDVWGCNDLDVESRALLTVASRFSGQVLGAFDHSPGIDRLVGFSLAFASLPFGHLHSHRVGVHPAYQNMGVGKMLKLAQRQDACARGVDQIQWTFDPMQPRNAWFNFVRLGGIARCYLPDLYGITTSLLHGGLPTDRLLIEWNLNSERVRRVLVGEMPLQAANRQEVQLPAPASRSDPEAQATMREEFLSLFKQGYAATGFRRDGGTHFYILEKL